MTRACVDPSPAAFLLSVSSLELYQGDLLCLSGPGGAGKTTLLQCAAGLRRMDAGVLEWFGEPFPGGGLVPDVAYVPATPEYYPFLTVMDALQLRAARDGINSSEATRLCYEKLAAVNLESALCSPVARLSSDERRRLSIAEALLAGPRALLVDLSSEEADSVSPAVLAAVRSFADRGGAAMVTVRSPMVVAEFATRLAIISSGWVVQCYSADGLDTQPFSARFVAETLH